jgi:branched-chain amino acid transport system substrate-binding protein
MRAGAQLYFDAVNASGGIHGAQIRLISKDDGYRPRRPFAWRAKC